MRHPVAVSTLALIFGVDLPVGAVLGKRRKKKAQAHRERGHKN
jgi:hypothetical protein